MEPTRHEENWHVNIVKFETMLSIYYILFHNIHQKPMSIELISIVQSHSLHVQLFFAIEKEKKCKYERDSRRRENYANPGLSNITN